MIDSDDYLNGEIIIIAWECWKNDVTQGQTRDKRHTMVPKSKESLCDFIYRQGFVVDIYYTIC
jgi:hypothetical protein